MHFAISMIFSRIISEHSLTVWKGVTFTCKTVSLQFLFLADLTLSFLAFSWPVSMEQSPDVLE